MSLFRDDEDNGTENFHFDFDSIDATEFFTALIVASAHIFNKFTGNKASLLEFTHIANQLAVQCMMENKEKEV